MDKRTLGKTIRQQRRLQELTVTDLANDVGITRGYLHRIERGDAKPTIDTLSKIFEKLKIELTLETKVMID